MKRQVLPVFTRRERQIMDIVYRLEKVTAREILEAMSDPPSYTSVRSHLRAMIDKVKLSSSRDGMHYVYSPVVPKKTAKASALRNILTNFFSGSPQELIATLIEDNAKHLAAEDLEQISAMIEKAKKEGR